MTLRDFGVGAPAVIVVDGGRRILFKNERTNRLISANPALVDQRGRLAPALADRCAPRPSVHCLFRPSGTPLLAMLADISAPGVLHRGTLLLIWDADSLRVPPAAILRRLFDLTQAEATTALATYEGRTPNEIAECRGRSINTVRTLLSRVFQKCAVKRQAELVRLIADITSVCSVAEGVEIGMGIRHSALKNVHHEAAWQDAQQLLVPIPPDGVEAVAFLRELSPHEATTRHYHVQGHEVICVLRGTLTTEFAGGVPQITRRGEARYIGSAIVHRGYNASASDPLQVLSINVRQRGAACRVDLPG